MTEVVVFNRSDAALAFLAEVGVKPTLIGLDFERTDLSYEEFEQVGRALRGIDDAWHWWVGDWLNFGEMTFGEEVAQAVDDKSDRYDLARSVTGKAQGTLQNCRWVAGAVAKSRRRSELSWEHHRFVAAMEPDEQTEWLNLAIDGPLNATELKAAIRDAKNPAKQDDEPEPDAPPTPEVTRGERAEQVLALVVEQAQSMTNGGWFIPDEIMAQARSLVGAE